MGKSKMVGSAVLRIKTAVRRMCAGAAVKKESFWMIESLSSFDRKEKQP